MIDTSIFKAFGTHVITSFSVQALIFHLFHFLCFSLRADCFPISPEG